MYIHIGIGHLALQFVNEHDARHSIPISLCVYNTYIYQCIYILELVYLLACLFWFKYTQISIHRNINDGPRCSRICG